MMLRAPRISGQTDCLYNYFRSYDPEIGRYISSDPIGLNGGLNTYGYALQNPLRFVDPDGKHPICAAWPFGIAACAIAAVGILTSAKKCSDGVDNASEAFKAADTLKSAKQERINCISDPSCDLVKEQELLDTINEADQAFRSNTVEAIQNLGTSVPGTSINGPIPTTIPDAAAGAIVGIGTSE